MTHCTKYMSHSCFKEPTQPFAEPTQRSSQMRSREMGPAHSLLSAVCNTLLPAGHLCGSH